MIGNKMIQRIGYGVSDIACNFVWMMMSTYLMIFYTDVFGISAGIVGTIMMLTRVLDAFTDVGMGILVDKTNTKWGKSRPYFLYGAIPFGIAAVAMFTVPSFSMNGKIIYAFVTYFLMSCAYTMVNIPMASILPSITSDSKERSILITYRMVFACIGSTIVTTFTLPLVKVLGNGDRAQGYFYTMIIYGTIAAILFLVTFATVKERVRPESTNNKERMSFKEVKGVLNLPLILLFTMYFMNGIMNTMRGSAITYFFTYNLGNESLLTLLGIGTFAGLPMTLSLPFLTQKLGKRNCVVLGSIIAIAGQLLTTVNDFITLAIGLVIFALGTNLITGTLFTMQPDIIDYTEYKSGKNFSGIISSLFGFLAKFGMGISSAIFGAMLSFGGYVDGATQSSSALSSIYIGYCWIPILTFILTIVLCFFYNLDSKMPSIQKDLEEKYNPTAQI